MTKGKIHILGICGTFMGGLAIIAKQSGYTVTGSDENIYPPMSDHLTEVGISIIQGYRAEDLPKADIYIVGNALTRGNESIEYLLNNNAQIISGPQWLYESILKDRKVIAVSGTHGKTTTTAMISWIFEASGRDVGYLIAGRPQNFASSARIGSDKVFIIEADEYDTAFFDKRSKFIHYRPSTLVINNIEFDHSDIFEDLTEIHRQFHNLVRTMPESSNIIYPYKDPEIDKVIKMGCWSKTTTYTEKEGSISFKPIKEDFSEVEITVNKTQGKLSWSLIGEYNAQNAMSSILACQDHEIDLENSIKALTKFMGVKRRQEILYEDSKVVLIDDFAHHPTAIKRTLEAIKARYPEHKIISIIEIRSNTMKSGFHDDKLVKSIELSNLTFWKGDNTHQVEELSKITDGLVFKSKRAVLKDIQKSLGNKTLILLMSNGSFGGLSVYIKKRVNQLLKNEK